jgi:type II secretory pathway component PulF
MQVPLSPMLDAAAKNAAGREARVLRRLAYRIDHGMPFGGAILTRYKDCPPRARGPILAAEEMNRLQDGLDEACRRLRRKAHVDRNHPSLSGVAYLLMLILAVVTGMAVFLVPMFHEILDGSGAEFPAKYNWTRLTVMMLATRGNELFAAVLAALGLALTLEKLWPGVLLRNWPFSAIHDFVAWWVPPFKSIHRIEQERALIHHLQSGLAGEQDLVRILDAAQRLELNRYLSRRVKLWRQAVQEGGDPHKAALASGIRPSIARVFASSQSPLRMCLIAEACLKQIQAQLDHRRDVVYATVLPFFIIGCGLIVSAIGLCFIAPLAVLTKMIL